MEHTNVHHAAPRVSLPSIQAMDFNHNNKINNSTQMPYSSHQSYSLPPPYPSTTRQLPPLPHQYAMTVVPQPPEFVTAARSPYMDHGTGYGPAGSRSHYPVTPDLNIPIIPSRQYSKTKEVKRRTKTGCMTCRKRRIKCDETRPSCKNCAKSKRECTGYDPVFQVPGSATTRSSAPISPLLHSNSPFHHRDYYDGAPASPVTADSPLSLHQHSAEDPAEFSYHRYHQDALAPQTGRAFDMGSARSSTYPRCELMTDHGRAFVPKRTIEELCCISGNRAPHVPPLPPDSTPNLESIQQVYDIAFALGLDKFLETGSLRWFVSQGFSHLVADRGLLAQFLLYLTIISNNFNPNQPENAATQSQEARITWALLNLVVKPAHDGNEEADKFSRRIKAVEALLTGEPLTMVRGSMADFIHSEDGAIDMDPAPSTNRDNSSVLEKQVYRRSEEFWRCVEKFAEAPRPPPETVDDPNSPLNQARELLDGLESRDIIYSMMLLCASHGQDEHPTSRPVSRAGSAYGGNGSGNGHHQKEPALARRFLESEHSNGRASNTVFATVAGLASRAFQRD